MVQRFGVLVVMILLLTVGGGCSSSTNGDLYVTDLSRPPGQIGLAHEALFLLVSRSGEPGIDDAEVWAQKEGWTLAGEPTAETADLRPPWALIEGVKREDNSITVLWLGTTQDVLKLGAFDIAGEVSDRLVRRGINPDTALIGQEVGFPLQ